MIEKFSTNVRCVLQSSQPSQHVVMLSIRIMILHLLSSTVDGNPPSLESNATFVEIDLEIEIKVEEKDGKNNNTQSSGSQESFLASTSATTDLANVTSIPVKNLTFEAVIAEYDNDEDIHNVTENTTTRGDRNDENILKVKENTTTKAEDTNEDINNVPENTTTKDNSSDEGIDNIADDTTTRSNSNASMNIEHEERSVDVEYEIFYRISLVQLLFFIIFILVLLGSCCSVNAICLFWHQSERRALSSVFNFVANNRFQDNKNMNELRSSTNNRGEFSKHKLTQDFVSNTLKSYDEETMEEGKRVSNMSGDLPSQDSSSTMNFVTRNNEIDHLKITMKQGAKKHYTLMY